MNHGFTVCRSLDAVGANDDEGNARGRRGRHEAARREAFEQSAPAPRHTMLRQRAVDAAAQRDRSRISQAVLTQRLVQLVRSGKFGGAARAGGRMRLHLARMTSIKLAVDERVHENHSLVIAGHDPFCSAAQAAGSNARPRANRDITVPTGTPTKSAMSR